MYNIVSKSKFLILKLYVTLFYDFELIRIMLELHYFVVL